MSPSIAIWGEIAALKLISPVFLPTPARVGTALQHGFLHADLGEKLVGTVEPHARRLGRIASIAGIALGALIGSSKAAREYIAPTLEFLRPLPASAVIPVAIAIFGLTPQMALGVIGFGAIWPVLLADDSRLRRNRAAPERSRAYARAHRAGRESGRSRCPRPRPTFSQDFGSASRCR